MRSRIITTLAVGSLGALLLPGALALVACLLWVHAQRYRALHGRILATLGQHRRWPRSQAAAVP
ncbi:MAG: hypothetical protein ACTHNM_09170 [Dyella sp.]|uniref:hypothetical protein n=1 Tax=Dyella sp. TaxID=1869338 RepID=UPI003F7E7329